MRGQGYVWRPTIREKGAAKETARETRVWWIGYSVRGKQHRESSGTTVRRDAVELLRQRIGKRRDGTLTGQPERVTLGDLKAELEKRYELKLNRSWPRAKQAFVHLEEFFGVGARVPTITKAAVAAYQDARFKAKAARDSIRYEVAILGAAFGVAVKLDLLATRPKFEKIAGAPARKGFFETADFAALVVELPTELADLVRFLYFTGWRSGEGKSLQWPAIDFDDATYQEEGREPVAGPKACFRIDETQTKGGDAREFPFADFEELRNLLLARWRARDGLHVFHRHGAPVGSFSKTWAKACTKAGLVGRLVHDLRRSAARNLQDDGFTEREIMLLCGWKSRSMFDRYNVRNVADLRRAITRRANSKQQTNKAVPSETVG